jgi:hypothetical protein
MKTNKIIIFLTLLLMGGTFLTSCDDEDSYEEMTKRERRAVNSFLEKGVTVLSSENLNDTLLSVDPIKVISEEEFAAQDSTTDLSKNEYVLLGHTGVYMQIIRKGSGKRLVSGESNVKVLCRYTEFNIMGDSVQTLNNTTALINVADEMTVSNSYGTLTGSFVSGYMKTYYSTTNVPTGLLEPLHYVNLGRYSGENDEIAKVRVIVPHSSGTTEASSKVYPCFYKITYEQGR